MSNLLKKFGILISEAAKKAYEDITVAVFAGAYKPPFAGDWNIITECAKKADMTVVFISNITEEYLSTKKLQAKWIFDKLDSLKKKLKKENPDNIKRIDLVFDKIDKLDREIDWNSIKNALSFTDIEIGKAETVQNAIDKIQEQLFETLAKHSLDGTYYTAITPEMSKQIFDVYNKDSSLKIKTFITEGDQQEFPMISAMKWVNENCKNCKILLCSDDESRNDSKWNSVDVKLEGKDKNGNRFDLINKDEYSILNTIMSSKSIKQSIQNGEWDNKWLPESLSKEEREEVYEILTSVSKKEDVDL